MGISIHRILFPTDFSDPAQKAQEYATSLADRFGAELHLLHVVPPPMPSTRPVTPWVTPENEVRLHMEMADQRVKSQLCPEWTACHSPVYATVMGFAVEAILNYAKTHDIDLIVMGTHGHTGLSHYLIGSVAEKVVRTAICPVLTVHPQGHQFVVESRFSAVLASAPS